MDFLKRNMSKTEVQDGNSSRIREAENGWMKVKKSMDDAIYELFLRGDISADSAVSYAQKLGR